MKRHNRLIGVAIVAGLVSAMAVGTAPAMAADLSEIGANSFANIASCSASSDNLLAAIVVDSSGSLKETDPSDQRVGAVLQALDSLQQLQGSDNGVVVQASLATFGAQYVPLVGWGSVEGAHAESLTQTALGTLASRDTDKFTDYRAALLGAQTSLNTQAASLGGSSCKVIFWFTDGKLDVGTQTEAARVELCAPQGIVDGVRGDQIAVVALALFVEGGSVNDQERDRLRAIAEGTGGGESCGTVPIPSSSSSGSYLRATDASSMRRLFAQATSMIEGATPSLSTTCPGTDCADGTLTIPLDPGVEGFRIILERSDTSDTPTLTGPDGQVAQATPGTRSLSGSAVTITDRDGLMTIDVRSEPSTNSSQWQVRMNPSSATVLDLYYFWGAAITVAARDELYYGESSTIEFSLVDSSGHTLNLDDFGSVNLTASVDGTPISPLRTKDNRWEATIDVSGTDAAPTVRIEATARAVSAPTGVKLGPATASVDLETRFPPIFASIETTQLDFPAITGTSASQAELRLRGSTEGATRACFETTRVHAPDAAGTVTATPAVECIDIPTGESASVSVTLDAANAADGRVDGDIAVLLVGVNGTDTVTVAVPFGASMVRPVNEPLRLGLIALFVVLALAIVWIVAELSRRIGDRFALSIDSRVAAVPVILTPQGLRREPPTDVLLDPAADFRPVNTGTKKRFATFATSGVNFGRSFPLANPLSSARPWVAADSGAIVATLGNRRPMMTVTGNKAPVRLPGSVDSVLIVEDAPGEEGVEIRCRLVVIVDSREGVASVLEDRVADIEATDWDRIIESIAAASKARAAAALQAAARTSSGSTSAPSGSAAAASTTAESSASDDGPPPMSWDDSGAIPASGAPTPSTAKPSYREKANRGPRSSEPDVPPNHPSDPPPSPINFWD